MNNFVALGLGSNVSWGGLSPSQLLLAAAGDLKAILSGAKLSTIRTTSPLYYTNQPQFSNALIAGWTALSPNELLSEVHKIEKKYGREREKEFRNGPRSLDIDIELYFCEGEEVVLTTQALTLPHPRIMERRFVLEPLVEVLKAFGRDCKAFEEALGKV